MEGTETVPLYEYRCGKCGKVFTELQPMSAPKTGSPCPQCGSVDTRRNVSTFASKPAAPSTPGGGCLPGG